MMKTTAHELLSRHHSAALGLSDEHKDYGGRSRSDMEPHALYVATGEYVRDGDPDTKMHRTLMRAAHALCGELDKTRLASREIRVLWAHLNDLCKDYDPTEE